MQAKTFDITGVAEILTGVCLGAGGMTRVHEIMDHFYPGIMTIGCSAMAKNAAAEIARQHPQVAQAVDVRPLPRNSDGIDVAAIPDWLENLTIVFGSSIELHGPLEVSEQEVTEAFAAFNGER